MARHNKTISCICGTKAEKVKGFALTQTAKECVCTEIKNGKEKDLGFPVTVNITTKKRKKIVGLHPGHEAGVLHH